MMPKSTATMRAVGVDEQVARMHVGVEEAVAQRVAQEGLHQRAAERRQVEPARCERGAVGQRRAVDPFEREHVARGALPVDRRHAEVRIVLRVVRASRRCAAASSRRSISIVTERASVSTTSTSRSRRASAEWRSALRAAK